MQSTIFALKRAYQATRKTIDERLAAYDLSWAQLDIILHLKHQGPLEQRQLQADLGITSATLTRTLDGLARKGYIQRVPSPEDARVKEIHLTKSMLSVLQRLVAVDEPDLLEKFFAGFSPAEISLFTDWLQRVAENMGDTSAELFKESPAA